MEASLYSRPYSHEISLLFHGDDFKHTLFSTYDIVCAGLYCVYGQQEGRGFHNIPLHKHATRSHWQVIKVA
jgi:hypothetical protein